MKDFPYLATVARSVLAVQATSAASERVFSSAGFIGNRHRSRLSVDSLELCTLVKDALKQGIDLTKEAKELWRKKNSIANKKRSETQIERMKEHATKKAREMARGVPPFAELSSPSIQEEENMADSESFEIEFSSDQEELVLWDALTGAGDELVDAKSLKRLFDEEVEGEEDENIDSVSANEQHILRPKYNANRISGASEMMEALSIANKPGSQIILPGDDNFNKKVVVDE